MNPGSPSIAVPCRQKPALTEESSEAKVHRAPKRTRFEGGARLSRGTGLLVPLRSVGFGQGIGTKPEMAAFTNGGTGRYLYFDDHNSSLISCIG